MLSLLSGQGFHKAGNSHERGPEWHGPCPVCGGRDRFHVWPEQGSGSFWCRGCGKGGDLIEFYRWRDGMTYKEACTKAGIDPRRYSQNSAPVMPKAKPSAPAFSPSPSAPVLPTWAEHAGKFAEFCQKRLAETPPELSWLAARGIDASQAVKFGLGWNPTDAYRPRQSWGLPEQRKPDGTSRKLWLPRGLVIPQTIGGQVARLRIRRPEGEPKYYVVPGSGREPLMTKEEAAAYVVVESELDAILLDAVAGDVVGVVAMGNASAKPTAACHAALSRAVHLSICLDSDAPRQNKTTGKMESPGAQSALWWRQTYAQAERVPVIGGKDPGDAYKGGVNLRAWVLAGLPPRFQRTEDRRQRTDTTVLSPREAPDSNLSSVLCPPSSEGEDHPILILTDGREVHLTDDRELWNELAAGGQIVFFYNELSRLGAACASMSEADRGKALGILADVKQVFAGAYIQRGVAA